MNLADYLATTNQMRRSDALAYTARILITYPLDLRRSRRMIRDVFVDDDTVLRMELVLLWSYQAAIRRRCWRRR
jgi:hypothetical protein